MGDQYKFSIVIPAYNPGIKLVHCLKSIEKSINFFKKKKKIKYEILLINDGGDEINLKSKKKPKDLRQINLKKNRGVGYARQYGVKISKYNNLFFIDSDLVIKKNTLFILYKDFHRLKNIGSIGPIQDYKNLNKDFTSDFVCAKSCYGYEDVEKYVKFSAIRSECCLIDKKFLKLVGGWHYFPSAGGEEFDLGHRIIKKNRINYLTKNTSYTTYWDNIFNRSKKIIIRTSNYFPVFLSEKKFETKGSFATSAQALSAFFTLLILISLFFFYNSIYLKNVLLMLIMMNLIVEFNFLKFVFVFFNKKTFFLSLIGIFIVNFSIIIGFLLGIFNLLKLSFRKKNLYRVKF